MIKKICLLFVVLLVVTSCTKTLDVLTICEERERLDLSNPTPLSLRETDFKVVNRQNAESTFKGLEQSGQDPVLVALPWDSYENLALNLNDLKNYIQVLQQILDSYRNYYEPTEQPVAPSFWNNLWQ